MFNILILLQLFGYLKVVFVFYFCLLKSFVGNDFFLTMLGLFNLPDYASASRQLLSDCCKRWQPFGNTLLSRIYCAREKVSF